METAGNGDNRGDERLVNRRYRLESRLGKGGMGTVFRAQDLLRNNRIVALKLLEPASSSQSPDDLQREFYTLTRLRHPNLVGVYDLGVDRETGKWFLTMEYVEGSTLAAWRSGDTPAIDELAVPLLRALDFIHERGIVHADIKPENILLPAGGGEPKIADFGLAAVLGAPASRRGTLPYTAPEVLRGDAPGPLADLYSLGATLYHSAAGRPPFDAPTPDGVIEGHLRGDPPFPDELVGSLPPGFAVVLRHLLAKEPTSRPSSGAEVIQAINDLAGTRHAARLEERRFAAIRRGVLVGRAAEIRRMNQALKRLVDHGQGGVILLTGAPGSGKTRLAEETRIRAQMAGFTVVVGECRGTEEDPFDAATAVLRDLAALAPATPAAALSPLLPEMGAGATDQRWDRLQTMEAAAELLRSTAATVPLVIVLEDLHRADRDLAELVGHLERGTRHSPVLLLLTARLTDDGRPFHQLAADLRAERETLTLELGPLSASETGDLAASLLGGETDPEVNSFVFKESAGNPYRVAETLESLIHVGALRQPAEGQWCMDRDVLSTWRLPDRIEDAALWRVRELEAQSWPVLEILAVAGGPVLADTLARLSKRAAADLQTQLDALVDQEILARVETAEGTPAYTFNHAFLRDALYHALGRDAPQQRAELHQRLAADLIEQARQPAEDLAAELARHFDAAGQRQDAIRFGLQAASRARQRWALESASRHYKRVLELLAGTPEKARLAAQTWEDFADIQRLAGRPEEADQAYARALELDVPERTECQQAALLWKRGLALNVAGRYEDARIIVLRAEQLYRQLDDKAGLAQCANALGVSYARQAEHERAETHYRRALEIRRSLDNAGDLAGSLANLGMVTFFQGRLQEGRRHLEEALDLYRQSGDAAGAALASNNLGLVSTAEGRLEEAGRRLQEARSAYEQMGSLRLRAQTVLNLGRVMVRRGAFDRAVELATEATDLYTRLGMRSEAADACEVLGDAHRDCGRLEAALEAHERGLALARRAGDTTQEGFSLCALVLDHLAAGDPAAAAALLEKIDRQSLAAKGSRLRDRMSRVRASLLLAQGRPEPALEIAAALTEPRPPSTDPVDLFEARFLKARILTTLGRFAEALQVLENLLSAEEINAFPARAWQLLRLQAGCLTGAGRHQESHAARVRATEAFARLRAELPAAFQASLDRLPAATSLRMESGGSDTDRVAPDRFLETMYKVIEALTSFNDTEAMLDRVMELALELLGAERGLILLFPEDGGKPRVAVARDLEDETIADAISYSCQVVEQGRMGQSLAAADAMDDLRLKDFASVHKYEIRSILCVPMRADNRIMGTVYLDSRTRTIGFDDADLRFLEAFAQHAATALDNSQMMRALERENLTLRQTLLDRYSFANIVGRSRPMQEVFSTLRAVADSSLPVLVRGDSGTGKELVARALHYNSPRRNGPFLTENCAAFPDTLLESQLFGHVRGAFTGASTDQQGLFQEAHGGTLFLDEIGEMSPSLQARLTRVLETGEFRPVGGSTPVKVDVRVVAATHRDLDKMVADGLFRRDLLFRLNVINIDLPPLRERRDDIPLLVSHFLAELSRDMRIQPPGIEDGALELLSAQDWPGNVRQLRNEISRLLVFRRGEAITTHDVREICTAGVPLAEEYVEADEVISLKEMERRHILRALQETDGDRTRAARLLKVGRATVFRKIKDYKLDA